MPAAATVRERGCGSGSCSVSRIALGCRSVCHYPPGTSKWNRVEHRLFSYIAMNWRGKPLVSLTTVVNLIGATTTRSGLRVRSEIDTRSYPQGVKVTDEQMQRINLSRHEFHDDWNYTIEPISVS